VGEITPHPALTPNIRVLCECIARSKGELFLSLAQVLPPDLELRDVWTIFDAMCADLYVTAGVHGTTMGDTTDGGLRTSIQPTPGA
jgi:hypothetical protein